MRHILAAAAAALLLTSLAACDFVRFPGDGGPSPETPEPGPAVPPGAPGPPPPVVDDDPLEEPIEATPVDSETDAPEEEPAVEIPADTDTPPADDPSGEPDVTPPEEGETPVEPQPDPEPETPVDPEPDTPVEEPAPVEPVFSYFAPGALLAGSGGGFPEQVVHSPNMLFPIKSAPAYLQSQVFSLGGGVAGGDQCDARNYAYPWRDNFCETRSANRNSPFCPTSRIHQGQDIRVGTAADCNTLRRQAVSARGLHEVVAVEDGVISSIGTYTVKLRSEGSIYNYMHLNMKRLQVTAGQTVKAGDLLGYVSNDFGGTATTIHLHFEIMQNTADHGWVHVAPYLSLVAAYERRENGPGEELEPEIGIASADAFVIPEGYEIIE